MRAYVTKTERQHFLRLLGIETRDFETNKFQERNEKREVRMAEKGLKEESQEDEPMEKKSKLDEDATKENQKVEFTNGL